MNRSTFTHSLHPRLSAAAHTVNTSLAERVRALEARVSALEAEGAVKEGKLDYYRDRMKRLSLIGEVDRTEHLARIIKAGAMPTQLKGRQTVGGEVRV